MDEGIDVNEFVDLVKYQNTNLDSVLKQEPFLDEAILLMSMALAVDCKDWTDPEEAIDICKTSIDSVTHFAESTKSLWKETPSILVFGGQLDPTPDEWNDKFMDAQGLFRELLEMHIEQYGADNIEHAYKETTMCLTYMISIGCARSNNSQGAATFAKDMIDKTYTFINEHCKLKKIEN